MSMLESFAILTAGALMGLLHAFDADHVMAVSTLSQSKRKVATMIKFAAQWGCGHGLILLGLAIGLTVFNLHLPAAITQMAELMVGGVLIVLGLGLIWQINKGNLHLKRHQHGQRFHRHWVTQQSRLEKQIQTSRHDHKPILVGGLHGMAGSAPALALIPVAMQGQVVGAIIYMLMFSLGCLLGMTVFGLGFGQLNRMLYKYSQKAHQWFSQALGLCAATLGLVWILQ
ncbi:hypothetical protein C2869_22200 (plasmid) [Saccharobesus litoralis]|uniref:Urease accessory protein UreH-like transmembrane domain-containing protein n=1 Tax=Saccharobesus litoralis TaxID=2172099 RepID=A0A2S0VYB6_9ALTE|nr:sulfite exporter TauE/SafE family protein [Saccharobesus litoralis]AWB69216.1 hypothetical protein C2869_22200 [Saccharobesus litoralis]